MFDKIFVEDIVYTVVRYIPSHVCKRKYKVLVRIVYPELRGQGDTIQIEKVGSGNLSAADVELNRLFFRSKAGNRCRKPLSFLLNRPLQVQSVWQVMLKYQN